jgi:hypothetical protein
MISNPYKFPKHQFTEFHQRFGKSANFNIGIISSSATWKNQNKQKIKPFFTSNHTLYTCTISFFFYLKKKQLPGCQEKRKEKDNS